MKRLISGNHPKKLLIPAYFQSPKTIKVTTAYTLSCRGGAYNAREYFLTAAFNFDLISMLQTVNGVENMVTQPPST